MLNYLFVCAVGLVTAGVVRNAWPLLTGSPVSLQLLAERGLSLPIRSLVLVVAAPLLLISAAFSPASPATAQLMKWWIVVPAVLGMCFAQGVVVIVALRAIG